MNLVPSWVEGIYHMVVRLCTFFWGIIKIYFGLLIFFIALVYFVWQFLGDMLGDAADFASPVLAMIGGSITAMDAMLAAGWPEEIAKGVNYANQHVPLGELFLMIASLSTLWVICSIIRIVKSWIPWVS